MSTTGATPTQPPLKDAADFSLVLGGPLYRLVVVTLAPLTLTMMSMEQLLERLLKMVF